MSNDTKLGAAAMVLAVAIIAFGFILEGVVLNTLWDWFIVPKFNAPSLGVPTAIGIALFGGLISHQTTPTDDKTRMRQLTNVFVVPVLVLITGFVVRLFL